MVVICMRRLDDYLFSTFTGDFFLTSRLIHGLVRDDALETLYEYFEISV